MGARKERRIQRGRLAAKVRPGEARFGPELDWEKLWRDQVVGGQDERDKWKQTAFFSRDSEAAFGSESATRGGSLGMQRGRLASKVRPGEARFELELDWEKLWRDQVAGVKMSETNGNKLLFFLGIQRQRLAAKVRPGEARFGLESEGEKLWWRQVFRARMGARKERKWFILIGIQRGRLAAKVRPGEPCVGPELDWEKLRRDQVVGVKMSETNGNKLRFFQGFRGSVWQRKCDQASCSN